MYTQIFARSVSNESAGKTARVWSDVDKLDFLIDEKKSMLVIKASCYDDKGYTDDYDVQREFWLELEKQEVEKLVSTALNHKLLKKLDIANLAQIDKISALENELEQVREELAQSLAEQRTMRSRIRRAIGALIDKP